MCPMCISTAAIVVVGTAWTGGLTAFVVEKFRPRNIANRVRSFDSQSARDLIVKSNEHEKEQS